MSYIDPNSPEFQIGKQVGKILKKVLLYSSIGLFGYLIGTKVKNPKHNNINMGNY